jgi:hypothetical protein
MPRLIDDLRAPSARLTMPRFVRADKTHAWQDTAQRLLDILTWPELPVLLIDNVAEYFFSSDQEYWDLSKDFPNFAPPYPAFWVEHKMVKQIHSKEKGNTDIASLVPRGRVGMLIHALDPADCQGQDIPASARWILWCELFIDFGKPGVTADGPHGSVFACIDAEGEIIEPPSMQSFADSSDEALMMSLITWFYPAFLAVSFLHCRNVSVVENHVPAPLAKRFRERRGIAPCSYKTLIIEPLKKILRTEGRSAEHGIQSALFICRRGHFRDYREGRGLFGKYKQLVWMPRIVRGHAPPREIIVKI